MFSLLPSLPRPLVRAVVGIWRRRWLVLVTAWIVSALGWLGVMMIPDSYESRAQVYINTDTAIEAATAEIGSRTNLDKSVRIVRTQLLSRDNLERVIYDAGLDGDIYGPVELERRLEALADDIEVESKEDQYFEITYWDQDPVVAQRVVSSVLELFIEQNLSAAIADVDGALAALDTQIEDRRLQLEEVEAKIADFRAENASELAGTDRVERRLEVKESELARVDDQIGRLQLQRTRLRGELSGTQRYSSGNELDDLKVQLASLQAQFNDNYPDILRLKARIAELEAGGASLPDNPEYVQLERSMAATNDELAQLSRQRRRVQAEIEDLELSGAQTPEAEAELTTLLRDRAQIEQAFKSLRDKRDETALRADVNAAGGSIEYERYEAPRVAAEPGAPARGLLSILVLVLGLGVGTGLAYLLSVLDKTYTQVSDLEEALGLPVLGAMSPSPTAASRARVFGDRLALLGTAGALVAVAGALYYFQEIRVGDGGTAPQQSAEAGNGPGALR